MKYRRLTLEAVTRALEKYKEREPDDLFVLHNWCTTRGMVKRTSIDLNHCGDPSCKSCNKFMKDVHEAMKKITQGKSASEH